MELTENPRDGQRAEAASVMAELSQFRTLAPSSKILVEELERSLNHRFGRPAFPRMVDKFGYGVGFAFGEPIHLTLRGGSDDDRRKLEETTGMSVADFEADMERLAEYHFLLGPPRALRAQVPGYDPYAARRSADAQLASFNVLINTLRTNPDIAKRPLDAIVARQFTFDFLDLWTRVLIRAGFSQNRPPFHSKEEATEFLKLLPSQNVVAMIQYHYLKNLNRDWTINDLRDVAALSLAIPYCDIVITDKKAWDVTVNRAHLDAEFRTVILRRLADLPEHLPRAS
jgi:hypothetical protein